MQTTFETIEEKNVTVVHANVPVVEIDKLNVRSKGAHLIKNVSTVIPKNKITVLLGPSGCGKTTLLKCLNRLTDLYPDLKVKGSIRSRAKADRQHGSVPAGASRQPQPDCRSHEPRL